jgi:hypothetical protein
LPAKGKECSETAVARIVQVAGEDKEIRLRIYRVVNDTLESSERCRLELIPQLGRNIAYSSKRAVEMEIGRMNESQWLHTTLLTELQDRLGLDISHVVR